MWAHVLKRFLVHNPPFASNCWKWSHCWLSLHGFHSTYDELNALYELNYTWFFGINVFGVMTCCCRACHREQSTQHIQDERTTKKQKTASIRRKCLIRISFDKQRRGINGYTFPSLWFSTVIAAQSDRNPFAVAAKAEEEKNSQIDDMLAFLMWCKWTADWPKMVKKEIKRTSRTKSIYVMRASAVKLRYHIGTRYWIN